MRQQLQVLWQRRRLISLAAAVCTLVTALCGVTLVIALAAGYWTDQPPISLRWALLVGAGLAVAAAAMTLLRRLTWKQNLAQNARYAESALESIGNGLINTLQLSRDATGEPELVQAAIDETAAKVRAVNLTDAIDMRSLKRRAAAAGLAAALLATMLALQGPHVRRAMFAVLKPTRYVPTIATLEVLSVTPGDATLYSGQTAAVSVAVRNDQFKDYRATLFLTDAAGKTVERAMVGSSDRRRYSLPLGVLTDDVRYRIRIADTFLPTDKQVYTIEVVDRPGVAGLDATYTYPAYTTRAEEVRVDIAGPIKALVGTKVRLGLRLRRPAGMAFFQLRDESPGPMADSLDRQTYTCQFIVSKDGGYNLAVCDSNGRVIQRLPNLNGDQADDAAGYGSAAENTRSGYFDIRAIPDVPPKVAFIQPGTDTMVPPGGRLDVKLRATDDFGLTEAQLWLNEKGQPDELAKAFVLDGQTDKELTHTFTIDADTPVGTILVYRATATDNRRLGGDVGPQVGKSPNVFEILVQSPADVEAERIKQCDQLHEMLRALLKIQTQAKLAHMVARRAGALEVFLTHAEAVLTEQRRLRAKADGFVAEFPFRPEMTTVRQALTMMAANDMVQAVAQAQVLGGLRDMGDSSGPSEQLLGTQDRIIEALEMLLAYLPVVVSGKEPKLRQTPAGDLPPEFKDKLAALAEKLAEFIEEQKKVIAAGEGLAKKPVDQFTEDDQRLLQELRTAEDKWEKFLNEKFADFSRMAEQDFSNPSLLAELMSIKTDVTMAKDALSEKAKEIAVATESMSAAAENAKELNSNIEKWLMDTPDRIQWKMEDPGGQDNLEMPELPSELEDMVGDLMEDEEDLFDQIEDITSKAFDSFDKGIGWATMDGPISSMNAQGVTGNQLPNTSEISGRSGEGRQGKSLGEFVENKFVGKGGRRTPSRLTPEPFQRGQVKDQSTEPPGGSTGGGKVGGAGGEGLEGPVPPPMQEQLGRLAGRQAQLINRAERIRQKFTANDYGNFRFTEAITLMNRVRGDLVNYRYRNALRRRDSVIGSLRSSHEVLTKPMEVIEDASATTPKYIRDDIEDAMQNPLPPQYRAVLESYLDKLAGGR